MSAIDERREELIARYAEATKRNAIEISRMPLSVVLQSFREFADELAALAPQQAAPMQGVKARLFIRNYLIERDEACGFVSDEDEWDESAREIYEGLSVLATPEAGTSEPVADALRSGLSLLLLADAIGAGRFDAIIPEVAAAQLRTADALLQRLSAPAQAPVDGEAVRDRDVILRGVVESRMEGRLAKVLGISQYPSTSALDFDELLEIVSDRLAAAPSARKEKAE